MRLLRDDREIAAFLLTMLKEVVLRSESGIDYFEIMPWDVCLPEENIAFDPTKGANFYFSFDKEQVSFDKCLKSIGIAAYHLSAGISEYTDPCFLADGYITEISSIHWPLISNLLKRHVKSSIDEIKEQVKFLELSLSGSEEEFENNPAPDIELAPAAVISLEEARQNLVDRLEQIWARKCSQEINAGYHRSWVVDEKTRPLLHWSANPLYIKSFFKRNFGIEVDAREVCSRMSGFRGVHQAYDVLCFVFVPKGLTFDMVHARCSDLFQTEDVDQLFRNMFNHKRDPADGTYAVAIVKDSNFDRQCLLDDVQDKLFPKTVIECMLMELMHLEIFDRHYYMNGLEEYCPGSSFSPGVHPQCSWLGEKLRILPNNSKNIFFFVPFFIKGIWHILRKQYYTEKNKNAAV